MELVRSIILNNQDTIKRMANLAAKNPEGEGVLAEVNQALNELRATDKMLRDKLLVLLMAKEQGWPAAKKLARRMNGEYENPHVAKVLEEEEKRKEKERKDKEKDREKAKSGNL